MRPHRIAGDGHGPHLPEHRALRAPDGPRQPDAGAPPAHPVRRRRPPSLWLGRARNQELEHRRHVEEIVDFLELEQWRALPVGLLPYGVQKRVELGRALAMEPKLLLLDEPVGGHEPRGDRGHRPLHPRHPRRARTCRSIMVEHDMGLVMDLADRVMVVDFGVPITTGSPDEVQRHPDVVRAYLGEEVDAVTDPVGPSPATRIRDHAAAMPARGRAARQVPRRLAGVDLGVVLGARPARRPRLPRPGRRAGRPGRDPLGEPPGVAASPTWGRSPYAPPRSGSTPPTRPPRSATCSRDSGASVIVVEDQEQLDKTLAVIDELPDLRTSSTSSRAASGTATTHDKLMSWEEFLERGRQHRGRAPGRGRRACWPPSATTTWRR